MIFAENMNGTESIREAQGSRDPRTHTPDVQISVQGIEATVATVPPRYRHYRQIPSYVAYTVTARTILLYRHAAIRRRFEFKAVDIPTHGGMSRFSQSVPESIAVLYPLVCVAHQT